MSNLAQKFEKGHIDKPKWEMIDGVIVMMSPRPKRNHTEVTQQIFRIFDRHLWGKKCRVYMENMLVTLTRDDRFVPDIAIICDTNILKDDGAHGAPDLIVEVLSFSTSRYDKGHKKKIYGKAGVKEYWIVDTKNRTIEVYLNNDGIMELDEIYTAIPERDMEAMSDEDKAKFTFDFKTSLFDDLVINVYEVFQEIVEEVY
ncbi:MAG: Uma2 family endonuclease [Defluviitaleaceae bacterium]|nr:Uma2 family endonuclease [Defluviitaleaceae bacterium]